MCIWEQITYFGNYQVEIKNLRRRAQLERPLADSMVIMGFRILRALYTSADGEFLQARCPIGQVDVLIACR